MFSSSMAVGGLIEGGCRHHRQLPVRATESCKNLSYRSLRSQDIRTARRGRRNPTANRG